MKTSGDTSNTNTTGASGKKVSAARQLFVPMHLEALVVSERNKNIFWKSVTPNYDELSAPKRTPLGKYMEAAICTMPVPTTPAKGIHLHWTLPRAYRHGLQQEADESPRFPYAPNRWLITRITDDGGQVSTKQWVLESDTIDSKTPGYNWMLLEKKSTGADIDERDTFKPVRIGCQFDYPGWTEKAADKPLFLTIMSPVDAGFAANYNSSKGVFGFHDPLAGVVTKKATHTYIVAGWISDPKEDILHGYTTEAQWRNRLDSLSWTLTAEDTMGDELPGTTVCHAMVNNVEWVPGGETVSAYPGKELKVAVGNTATEALATLVKEDKTEGFRNAANPYLSALQYNLLSKHATDKGWEALKNLKAEGGPGIGTRTLAMQAHERGFQSSNGGTVWALAKAAQEDGEEKHTSEDQVEPLDDTSSGCLAELNAVQRQFDAAKSVAQDLQGRLYGNWYKEARLNAGKDPEGLLMADNSELAATLKEIGADSDNILSLLGSLVSSNAKGNLMSRLHSEYDAKIEKAQKDLRDALKEAGKEDYELKETKQPPYYHPKDPVVVIEGLAPASQYMTAQELVVCRTSEQLANAISFIEKGSAVDVNFAALKNVPLPPSAGLPADIKALYAEAWAFCPLLSKEAARYALGYKGADTAINTLTAVINKKLSAVLANAGIFRHGVQNAVMPPGYAIYQRSKQPWIPLFMEWEVEWQPAYNSLQHSDVMGKWDFGSGDKKMPFNNIDFKLKAAPHALLQGTPAKPVSFKGRVALSADLKPRLRDMAEALGKAQAVTGMEPMYQSLSGLDNQFVTQESGIQLPPLLKGQNKAYPVDPKVRNMGDQYLWNPVLRTNEGDDDGFSPFRGGLLRVKNLFIIDAFGQNLPVINAYSATGSQAKQYYASSMEVTDVRDTTTGKDRAHIVMQPRICQPARLRFRWLSAAHAAKNTERETDSDSGTSPVCGWLLHNALDRSVMVFDSDGVPAGSVRMGAGDKAFWESPVGVDGKDDVPRAVTHPRMLDIVSNLLHSDRNTFDELVSQLHAMSVKGATARRSNTTSPNLPMGTPIAVATASCRIELKGLPARNWAKNSDDTNLSDVRFPIFIGNNLSRTDGVVGFLRHEHSNAASGKLDMPYAQYVADSKASFAVNQPLQLSVGRQLQAPPSAGITILVHPHLDVSVSSGLFPAASYRLPDFSVGKALEQINFSFMANPVLTVGASTNIPVPDLPGLKWKWVEKTLTKEPSGNIKSGWNSVLLENKKDNLLSYEQVIAREGWLKIEKK